MGDREGELRKGVDRRRKDEVSDNAGLLWHGNGIEHAKIKSEDIFSLLRLLVNLFRTGLWYRFGHAGRAGRGGAGRTY